VTTAFRHDSGGVDEQLWADHPRVSGAPGLELPARLLIIAAHPDDEALGAAGLISAATAAGIGVHIVIATDGEASHPGSTTHSPADLALIRRAEATAAAGGLGATVEFLGLPDGQLADYRQELMAAIERRWSPGAVVASPWRGDGHPDHQACALAVRAAAPAAEHWQFPIWAWHWADPTDTSQLPWDAVRRFDLTDAAIAGKAKAVAAYPSQQQELSPLPGDGAILTESALAHFRRPYEIFIIEPFHPAVDPQYFQVLYEQTDDPWGLADRFYEQRKRDLVIAALPRVRFASAFEPGCATGLLTERLAQRCDRLIAWDNAPRAVELATSRLAGLGNVNVGLGVIPRDWPTEQLDLIVLSEVAYYCEDLANLEARVLASLKPDGVLLACHWRHPALDHPQTAETTHAALGRGLYRLAHHVEEDFLLDVWSTSEQSVARSTGVLG
jgi:LmbE family N-acetylglucosaminyl deacetylase